MRNRERGASHVSLVWLIVVGVVALGLAATAWVQSSSVSQAQGVNADLTRDLGESKKLLDDTRKGFRDVSARVGFLGGGSETQLAALEQALATAKTDLGAEAPADAKTLEEFLNAAKRLASERKGGIDQREQRIAALQSEVKLANDAKEAARVELQKQIDDVNRRMTDQTARDAAQIANLEQQLTARTASAKENADQVTALREQMDKEKSDWSKRSDLLSAKNADLSTKLAFRKEPDRPKGSIVETSESLPIGYIDLGKNSRVQPGMRFEVVDYDAEMKYRTKGWAEVTNVDNAISEVRLEAKNRLDPISRGDILLNPLFDPKGARKAVLVGRFPISAGGRKGVETKLKDLGIEVVDKVDTSVDYLIVGSPDISNTGEIEDIASNPQVLQAEKLNTLRYYVRDLEGFFRR
jgi:hypothetical protein